MGIRKRCRKGFFNFSKRRFNRKNTTQCIVKFRLGIDTTLEDIAAGRIIPDKYFTEFVKTMLMDKIFPLVNITHEIVSEPNGLVKVMDYSVNILIEN